MLFNLEIKNKSGLSINPDIHHSKVPSSELRKINKINKSANINRKTREIYFKYKMLYLNSSSVNWSISPISGPASVSSIPSWELGDPLVILNIKQLKYLIFFLVLIIPMICILIHLYNKARR